MAPDKAERVERAIRTLFVIQLVSMGAMEMSGPFWPVHLRSLTPSDWLFALGGIGVYVLPMLGIMLTSSFWGRIGDRHGHQLMMVRALVGLSLTQLALAYCSGVGSILVLRFLQGACAGFIAPAQAYGVSIESPMRRARLFAFLQVSTNVGSLLGALAGGVILDQASFFWINIGAFGLCALCAAAAWALLPAATHAEPARAPSRPVPDAARRAAWRTMPIVGLLGIIGVLLVSRMITQTPFSLYVRSVFGVSNWVVGLCYGLLALGFVVSAARWARHFEGKPWPQVLPQIACVAAGCAALMLLAGLTRHVGVFIAIHFAWGVLLGATTPVLTALISGAAGAQSQGHVLGVAQSTSQFASVAGIALGMGLSQAAGLEFTYFFVALAYALAVVLIMAVRRGWGAQGAATSPERLPQ